MPWTGEEEMTLTRNNHLEAEIERLTDENRKMNKTLAADAIEIFELRAALEPFAKIEYPPACPDGTWVAKTTFCNNQLTAIQIRRARAALQPKEEGDIWFRLNGDERLHQRCASDDCGGQPVWRLELDGVGSNYCSGCKVKISAALQPKEGEKK